MGSNPTLSAIFSTASDFDPGEALKRFFGSPDSLQPTTDPQSDKAKAEWQKFWGSDMPATSDSRPKQGADEAKDALDKFFGRGAPPKPEPPKDK